MEGKTKERTETDVTLRGSRMFLPNFAVPGKSGFCSKSCQSLGRCSFARADIFLQVLVCLVFHLWKVIFAKVLFVGKANLPVNARKTLCSRARKSSTTDNAYLHFNQIKEHLLFSYLISLLFFSSSALGALASSHYVTVNIFIKLLC